MRSDLTTSTVGEHFDLENGFAFKSRDFISAGVPVIKIKNVKAGFFSEHEFSYVSQEFVAQRPTKVARPGDLLISMSGNRHDGSPETWVGKVAPFDKTDIHLINQRVGALRIKTSGVVDPRYAGYVLSSWPYQKQFIAIATSSGGQANLSPRQILGAEFSFPGISEQRTIAATLDALNNKIANNRALAADLEAMARAIFKSWFVDFDPVKAKMEGRTPPGMDADTAALFPDELVESELGLIPKGWEVDILTDAFELNPRYTLKKGVPAPYLEMSKVPIRGHVPDEVVLREFSSGTKFQNGDTLLARITPCLENGKSAHVDFLTGDQVGWGSTEFIVMRAKPPVPAYFGYLLCRLEAFREHAISSMTGTSGRQRVQPDSLARWQLAIPSESICKRFEQIVDPLRARIRQLGDESQELAQLRDTLLPRLISGKLRMPVNGTVDGVAVRSQEANP